jgi:hypothetical protein
MRTAQLPLVALRGHRSCPLSCPLLEVNPTWRIYEYTPGDLLKYFVATVQSDGNSLRRGACRALALKQARQLHREAAGILDISFDFWIRVPPERELGAEKSDHPPRQLQQSSTKDPSASLPA